MRLSSLRLMLLTQIAHLLRRWLNRVTVQLESVPAPPPEAPAPAVDPRRPPPPDHWVELVRQYAPQLLDSGDAEPSASPDQPTGSERKGTAQDTPLTPVGKVVDYRTGAQNPATLRPVPLQASAPRPIDVAKRRSPAGRPLRLEPVSSRSLAAEPVSAVAAGAEAAPVEPPTVRPAEPIDQRISPVNQAVQSPTQPLREIPTQAAAREDLSVRRSQLPFEHQQIREIDTSLPGSAPVPTIRTGVGQAPRLQEERTSVPNRPASLPPQTVLRPTLTPLDLGEVTADRWPALPDEPLEAPRDPSIEQQRRERLRREQEGSAWSE